MKGKTFLEQAKFAQARVELQNALQNNPKLADAYFGLALIFEQNQDWQKMYGSLIESIRLDPNHVGSHFKLGLAYIAVNQLDKASEEATLVERLQPGESAALSLRGYVLYTQGDKAKGLEAVRRAMDKEPSNSDTAIILSSLYIKEGRYADALAALNRSIDIHPNDINLGILKVEAEAGSLDYESAIADYHALVERNPDRRELVYGLIQLLVQTDHYQQAEAVVRGIIHKYPTDSDAKLTLVSLVGRRDEAEAENTLRLFATENPNDIPIHLSLANLYSSRQRFAEAKGVLDHIIDIDKNGRGGLAAKIELAKIALSQKDDKKATALIQQTIAADANNPDAHLLRAALRLEKNEMDAAISDLRIALGSNSSQDKILVLLANAYQRKGDTELAESNLRQALDINPGNLDAALPVAAKKFIEKDWDRAEEILNAALISNPGEPTALQMMARVRAQKKDWAGAQALAIKLGQQNKGSAAGHFLSGEIFAIQGNYNESIKQYHEALQEQPDFPEALRGLSQAYSAKDERGPLKAYLRAFIEKNPTIIQAPMLLAFAHATDQEWNDAVKVLQNALQTDPKSLSIYQALAAIYQAINTPGEEIEIYRMGLAALPDEISLMVGLGQAYEHVKDSEAAIALYQRILQKQPNLELVVNNLASVLADYRTDAESLKQASRLVSQFSSSTDPNLLDTYAWVAVRMGDTKTAIPILKQLSAAEPDVAAFHYHLGTAYYQASDKLSAKTELDRALALAKTQGDFVGIEQARSLLKEILQTSTKVKSS